MALKSNPHPPRECPPCPHTGKEMTEDGWEYVMIRHNEDGTKTRWHRHADGTTCERIM